MSGLKYELLLDFSAYSFFLVDSKEGSLEDRNKLVKGVIKSLYSLDFSFISRSSMDSVLVSKALLILLKPLFPCYTSSNLSSGVVFSSCLGNFCLSGQVFSDLCSVDMGVVFFLLKSSTKDPLFLNVVWEVLKAGVFCSSLGGFDSLKTKDSVVFFFLELYFMKAISYFLEEFSYSFFMVSFFPSLAVISSESYTPDLLFCFQAFLEESLKQCSPVVLSLRGFFVSSGFVVEGFLILVSPKPENKVTCLASISWLVSFLMELGVCDKKGVSVPQFCLYDLDHKGMVAWYSFVFLGLLEVFGQTSKAKSFLKEAHKILWGSCARVLAAKLKLGSVKKVYRKFGPSLYPVDDDFSGFPL